MKALKTIENLYKNMYQIALIQLLKKVISKKSDKSKTRKTQKSLKSRICFSEFSRSSVFDSQNRKLGFKRLGKKILRFPKFLRFSSVWPGSVLHVITSSQ